MELNSFEIGLITDYYDNEVVRLRTRYDLIRLSANEYDEDLKNLQLMRIEDEEHKITKRIEELRSFVKEID